MYIYNNIYHEWSNPFLRHIFFLRVFALKHKKTRTFELKMKEKKNPCKNHETSQARPPEL